MPTITKWTNVGVSMQSALGASQSISAITKANPGVVTYVGADPTNGDYIKLTVSGMGQLDGRVVRVANVNAGSNTLELEGVDTTLFDTFSSGGMEPVTFGTTLATATSITASGGDFDFIDVTTIHDIIEKQVPGLAKAANFSMENIWDPSDAGLVALKTASDNQAQRAIKFTFANGQKLAFNGYVGCSMLPTGNAKELVKTPVTITMFGKPSVYAS